MRRTYVEMHLRRSRAASRRLEQERLTKSTTLLLLQRTAQHPAKELQSSGEKGSEETNRLTGRRKAIEPSHFMGARKLDGTCCVE